MKKGITYSFSIAFLGMLLLPMVNSVTKIVEFERKNENRTFHDTLIINVNRLDAFPKDCDTYLSDNFEFRTPLINAFHEIKRSIFHVSPHPENVIIGYNGWKFMAQREIDIYTGKSNFTEEQLKEFNQEWNYRMGFLDSLGISSFWVICPMKHYVYGEHLPFNFNYYAGEARVDQLAKSLSKTFPRLIVNPKQALIKAKNKGVKVYYKNDNHWNLKAGEIVAKQIVARLKTQFPNKQIDSPSNYTWLDTISEGGIHKDFLGIESPLYEFNQLPVFQNENALGAPLYDFKVPASFPYPDQFQKRFVQKHPSNNLKVLVIRDSFGDQVLPFLKEVAGETVFIFDEWKYQLNEEIILKYQPDVVIFLGLETHLLNMINH